MKKSKKHMKINRIKIINKCIQVLSTLEYQQCKLKVRRRLHTYSILFSVVAQNTCSIFKIWAKIPSSEKNYLDSRT